jgi:hypothetical protein
MTRACGVCARTMGGRGGFRDGTACGGYIRGDSLRCGEVLPMCCGSCADVLLVFAGFGQWFSVGSLSG